MNESDGNKTTVYRIGGLKGDHCRDRIEHTLSHLSGVSDVSVDVGGKTVTVSYNPDLLPSGYIEESLQSLGYSIQDNS